MKGSELNYFSEDLCIAYINYFFAVADPVCEVADNWRDFQKLNHYFVEIISNLCPDNARLFLRHNRFSKDQHKLWNLLHKHSIVGRNIRVTRSQFSSVRKALNQIVGDY